MTGTVEVAGDEFIYIIRLLLESVFPACCTKAVSSVTRWNMEYTWNALEYAVIYPLVIDSFA